MSSLQPPAFATWLLGRPGLSRWNDGLAGDLIEEYQRHPSSVWYWRQVLIVIAIGVAKDLREHWCLVFRAIAVAVFIGFTSGELLDELPLQRRLIDLGIPFFGEWLSALAVMTFHEFLVCALAGWAVAWTHRARQATMVLCYACALFVFNVWCSISNFVYGWGRPGNIRFLFLYHAFTAVMVLGALIGGFAPVRSCRTRETI